VFNIWVKHAEQVNSVLQFNDTVRVTCHSLPIDQATAGALRLRRPIPWSICKSSGPRGPRGTTRLGGRSFEIFVGSSRKSPRPIVFLHAPCQNSNHLLRFLILTRFCALGLITGIMPKKSTCQFLEVEIPRIGISQVSKNRTFDWTKFRSTIQNSPAILSRWRQKPNENLRTGAASERLWMRSLCCLYFPGSSHWLQNCSDRGSREFRGLLDISVSFPER